MFLGLLALEFSVDWGALSRCRRLFGRRNLACRSGETLEEFQHQVQSYFLCHVISFSDFARMLVVLRFGCPGS